METTYSAMLKFIFLLLLLYVGKEIVCYVNKILYIRIQTNAAFSLNFEIVNHLKKVSPLVIGRTDLSYLSQRINNDANDVLIFFISSLTELIFSVFSAGIILFMIWKMDSIAFIVTMFLLALYFFIYIGFKKRIYNCSYGMKEEKSNFFSRLQEQLEKIEFIKIHSMDSFFLNRLVASYQKLYRSIFKQQATIQAFANLEGIVGAISVCILLWIGGKKILTGDMQIGYFYMISVYFNMILEYGKEIVAYGQEYQEAYVSFERIKSILEIKEQSKGCIRLNEIKQIRIQDLNFAYDQKETIKSFSTNLKKGKVYGLKGENGCGKSTLIKILMGMYVDEYQGNIIWNDTEMRNLDMDYIREHVISVTEQEPTLIADTIYNNIALYRKLDVKCIQRAVDCFGDSILKRDNWDLQINEKSSNISGGEKGFTMCGAGLTSFCIMPDGNIYPCAYVTNDEAFKIGNIKNGIDIELAQNLPRELFRKEFRDCLECTVKNMCHSMKCGYMNYIKSGFINVPAEIICRQEKLIYPILKDVLYELGKKNILIRQKILGKQVELIERDEKLGELGLKIKNLL